MEKHCYLARAKVSSNTRFEVRSPYTREVVGVVFTASKEHAAEAVRIASEARVSLTRAQRFEILENARALLKSRAEQFARLISAEAGLALFETRYEVGRTLDVLRLAATQALQDDGQMFSGDISPQGKTRKIFTLREPLRCAVAITPFNHPLNQVAHKIVPAIAAGTPVVLKPSEKTPLVALEFVELLYEAGLPGPLLSVLLGPSSEVAEALVQDDRVDLVSFTGSVPVGKKIARTAGYKKVVLELGGNDPLIILEDADINLAVTLAAEGAYRNSGQRCTAVKRILVQEALVDQFTKALTTRTRDYPAGDPLDEKTRVGTVIDEASASYLESVVKDAVSQGAQVLAGGNRTGALLEPTVIAQVPRNAKMIVAESFGPLAPIVPVKDLDDAIQLANSTAYGLSAGVVTNNLAAALRAVRELRCGMVNINEVPGYRVESQPFGGIKDSGLGIKEGVIEAMKYYTTVKTFSLPWA